MIEIRLVENKDIWESFVLSQPWTLFVQSWNYGEFYQKLGENFFVLGIYKNNALIGGSLVVTTHAKRGNFLYLPYGPILPHGEEGEALTQLASWLASYAKGHQYHFIRISPFLDDSPGAKTLFDASGCLSAPMHILAETTWLLDITKPEHELLSAMNKNHRNLIHRCEREGVRVVMDATDDALLDVNRMLDETVKKHHFVRFSRSYIENEFRAFAPKNHAAIFRAYLPDGSLDAAAIFMFYGTMSAYRHGASYGKDKRLPTSYLLQWRAIQEAKKRGMQWHNFWGIAPDGSRKTHPFAGITHFKTGFGGEQKNLLHCQDIPTSPRYWLNWGIETLRRLRRGF